MTAFFESRPQKSTPFLDTKGLGELGKTIQSGIAEPIKALVENRPSEQNSERGAKNKHALTLSENLGDALRNLAQQPTVAPAPEAEEGQNFQPK